MDRSLQDRYELELASGYSTLERVGDHEFQTDPNAQYEDDPYTALYEDAMYGGKADPARDQQFYIYQVEWPEGTEEPDPREVQRLGEELDSVFEGWIVNDEGDRVFALDPEEA